MGLISRSKYPALVQNGPATVVPSWARPLVAQPISYLPQHKSIIRFNCRIGNQYKPSNSIVIVLGPKLNLLVDFTEGWAIQLVYLPDSWKISM